MVHGLAFAALLGDLGLSGWRLVVSLLAFNVGVELAGLAVVLLLIAVIGDHTHAAWIAFAFGIVAHASFLDVRMRWREAHQFMGYGDGEDNVRAIR